MAAKQMITFFRSRTTSFRTRSAERDREQDSANVARVMKAIEQAIASCIAERTGLDRRLADVTARAAIVAGNGSDDYHEREPAVSERLGVLDSEVKNAQRRIAQLSFSISQFEIVRDELVSRLGGTATADASRGARQPAA
jgi:hypothetical protein